ncbi:MAG: hypothetical protein HRU77_01470 [Gammaproteobacteria bacterium]|nr:MAG: hypothetical protein HRU77_01470 [Gammaproteobacteria bacterium]
MAQIRRISSGEVIEVSSTPVFHNGVWDCGNQRLMDSTGTEYEPVKLPAKVSVIEFKLLFTIEERVAINAARETNAVVQDFYALLDDQRTETVDLSLSAVQEMLNYLVDQSLLNPERRTQILSYVPQ